MRSFMTIATLMALTMPLFSKQHSSHPDESPTSSPKNECSKVCDLFRFNPPDVPPCSPPPPTYNLGAQVHLNCRSSFFAEVDFIYWNVSQEYMDIGRSALFTDPIPDSNATPAPEATIATPSSEYVPGFIISIGANTLFDDWSIRCDYTYLRHAQTYHTGTLRQPFSANDLIFIPNEWFVNLSVDTQQQAATMQSSWKMHLDMADLLLSRPFYQGKRLVFIPSMGLKALWVRQSYDISAILATDVTGAQVSSHNLSQCWGIGPEFSGQLNWLLGKGFQIEGTAGMSLLYNRFIKRSHQEQFSPDVVFSSPINGHLSEEGMLRPINQLGLGLAWGTYFKQFCHMNLSARYDFTILWSQNAMREIVGYFANNAIGYSNPSGNLNLHGLTLGAHLDF